ncbi:hypothetical protein L9F63_011851, partial [Diploptera punctata]
DQKDKYQCFNSTPIDQSDEPYKEILNALSGSGDSVFNILRPLKEIKLNNSDSTSEIQNTKSDINQSAHSGEDSEYPDDDINNEIPEILLTLPSETNIAIENNKENKGLNMVS